MQLNHCRPFHIRGCLYYQRCVRSTRFVSGIRSFCPGARAAFITVVSLSISSANLDAGPNLRVIGSPPAAGLPHLDSVQSKITCTLPLGGEAHLPQYDFSGFTCGVPQHGIDGSHMALAQHFGINNRSEAAQLRREGAFNDFP
ncbi:hypothetical protein D3C76_1508020 [compost metagenome]